MFFSAVLIPALIIIFTLAGILSKTSGIEKRIIAEFKANNEQTEILKQNLIKMSSDINQSRNLLGLPETDYSFENPQEKENSSSSEPETDNTVYFRGFEYLKNHYNEVELYRKMSEIASSSVFKSSASDNSLSIIENAKKYNLKDINSGMLLFTLSTDNQNNSIVISSSFSSIDKGIFTEISAEKAAEYISSNSDAARELNKKLIKNIKNIKNLFSDSIVKSSMRKNSPLP